MKGGRRDEKGIVIITQEGNKFVGVSLTEKGFASNGAEIIKGELEIVGFKTVSTYYKNADWYASTGEIGEKCKKKLRQDRRVSRTVQLLCKRFSFLCLFVAI